MIDMDYHIEQLRDYAMSHTSMGYYSVHGIDHWDRVADNADLLVNADVDLLVVKAFAYVHDVERFDDFEDAQHGPRAAILVDRIRSTVLSFLNDQQIEQLKQACRLHTSTWKTEDATVNACFDADRLDLGRVGICPNPEKMATMEGRKIAEKMAERIRLCPKVAPFKRELTDKKSTTMYNREYTPERISELKANEIFVFGSNLAGSHGGGAARLAYERFGAVWGQGVGLQGQSYGIPTMHGGVEAIKPYVDEFIAFAKQHPEQKFLVTKIGCGIAGFYVEEIAPLFRDAIDVENIILPRQFVDLQ